jgi:Na+-transporting methylmalonyl-CoA/oxaloacetate decarboxylase gamma subunit
MMLSSLLLSEAGTRIHSSTAEEFGRMDPTGIAMAVIAMTIVFTSLMLLYITFKYIAKLYNIDFKKLFKKRYPEENVSQIPEEIPEETLAAISLALHLYHKELQGLEDAVMTFKNASKTYSPWSSKIYGLRRSPNH